MSTRERNFERQVSNTAALIGPCILARSSYSRKQCAEGYKGVLCGSCGRGYDNKRYGFYTAFTCTRCRSDGLLVSPSRSNPGCDRKKEAKQK